MPPLDVPVAPNTIAFIPPRHGPGVVGGAEAVIGEMATGLVERGHSVEILTTCARDHFTWANEFSAGTSRSLNGLTIRRFPTIVESSRHRDHVGSLITSGENVTVQDQQLWANHGLRCPELWHHVFDHGHRYRALIFAPYMFWTTYAVSQIHPDRSILMPCLHDEPEAYLDIYRSNMHGAAGILYLTEPERSLADRLYGRHDYGLQKPSAVIGAGVNVDVAADGNLFRRKFGIDEPFVYYAGRREWGKGWEDLLDGFAAYRRQTLGSIGGRTGPLKLVTSGVGSVQAPPGAESAVIDVGLLTDAERDSAMAAAAAYVQPSARESFSRTVLEAMLAGTPVVANGHSEVVRWHIERSGAGLVYHTQGELIECLRFIDDEPTAAASLAEGGRRYVEANYRPDGVLDRLETYLDRFFPPGQADLELVGSGILGGGLSAAKPGLRPEVLS